MPDEYLQIHAVRTVTSRNGRRVPRGALFLTLFLIVAACAKIPVPEARPDAGIPSRAAVTGVPLIVQEDFHCGPASLAMVHQWAGLDVSQAEVAELSFTPGAKGTYLADMLGSARRMGRLAVQVNGTDAVLREVAAGHPVIVFQNLGIKIAPRWHYGVVVGYDLAADRVILHSGRNERMEIPFRLFERTWARGEHWAIVVLPPDQLPDTADPWDIARAAAALERADQPGAAAQTYQAGATRWPDIWIFPFGLGNARYAQGDLEGARAAYRETLARDPGIAEAKANLATVEGELG